MSKICYICGKKPAAGRTIARRGLAKKKGGVGKKITGITIRRFLPNLQFVRAKIEGHVKRIRVCAKCLKAGKVIKRPLKKHFLTQIHTDKRTDTHGLATRVSV